MTRTTWDGVWMSVADSIAQRSKCWRRQVGAAIVTVDQELVALGFNGAPHGFIEVGSDCRGWCARAAEEDGVLASYQTCPSIHAEMNAIVRAGRGPAKSRTLYVTTSVCIDCAKVVPAAGIGRVMMRVDPKRDQHRDPKGVTEFLVQCGVEVVWVPD